MRCKYLFFIFLLGCSSNREGQFGSRQELQDDSSVHLLKNLKIKSLVTEFASSNDLSQNECVIIVFHQNKRENFINYFNIDLTEHTHQRLPLYPDRHCIIDGYLVFFYTEFNHWLDQDIQKSYFEKVVLERGIKLSDDSLIVENRTWRIKLEGDSITSLDKIR